MDRGYQSQVNKTTIAGFITNTLLGLSKVIVALLSKSNALLLDGVHSLTDSITDIFILSINKFAQAAPDKNHPYGHQKIETIGTLFIGTFLFVMVGALLWQNLLRVINHDTSISPTPVLIVSTFSLIIKELLYRYTYYQGKKINSRLLIANAWHHRSDALSSLVVLISAIGATIGIPYIDNLAAFIILLMIGKIGWDLIYPSLLELADTAIDEEKINTYKRAVETVDGVARVLSLRGRKMGHRIVLDAQIKVDSDITISEGHEIISWVMKTLMEKHREIADVVVHIGINSCTFSVSEQNEEKLFLPLRSEILRELSICWQKEWILKRANIIRLRYDCNQVTVEITLSKGDQEIPSIEHLDQLAKHLWWYNTTQLFFTEK